MNSYKVTAAKTKVTSKKKTTDGQHSRIARHKQLGVDGNNVAVVDDVCFVGRKKIPLNSVIRAVGVSLLEHGVADVALRIADDHDALLNVARRLEGREGLEVHELRALASGGAVFARGRVYDATTHRPRTWRLRIMLSARRGGGRR